MLATDLLELAAKNNACISGLIWLQLWINKHPNGTASDFFKSKQKRLNKSINTNNYKLSNKILKIHNTQSICNIENTICSRIIDELIEINFLIWCYIHLLDWEQIDYHYFSMELFNTVYINEYCGITKQQIALVLAASFEEE